MTYFSRRNNLVTAEYSGHEDVSSSLRNRIINVISEYIWVADADDFAYKLRHLRGVGEWRSIITMREYDWVFDTVEVFLELVSNSLDDNGEALRDMKEAFSLSGCVYSIDDEGKIALTIDEGLANSLEQAKAFLSPHEKAYKLFYESAGKLINRKDSPKNIIKDIFVALEEFLKKNTNKKDYGACIDELLKSGVISKTQKQVFEKIYAYRSDTFGVGHAGNSEEPDEIDALWFLETTLAQINLIGRKMEGGN